MPLDRAHITTASSIMLPTYAVMGWVLCACFVLQDDSRTATSPAFMLARELMDIRLWGVCFGIVAAVETVALFRRSRRFYEFGLTLGAGLCMFWAVLIFLSAGTYNGSFTSGVWPTVVVVAHFASTRSLATKEHR